MTHHHESRRNIRDDKLDGFQLQGSTQWDGFRHQRYRQYGFYGGRQDPDLDEGGEIGIDAWADRGIVTRGVLVDVAAELERRGDPLVPDVRRGIDHVLIEETLESQQTEVRWGDILLVRTGWLEWYLGLDEQERAARAEQLAADLPKAELPGLSAGLETVAWLWDHRIAAIAFDNPTVETLPYRKEDGWAHNRLLPLLGMPLGELWKLDGLSAKCAEVERYSFLLTSAPLNLRGAAGSPANAYAVL
jgi:kynurenine formamidase